MQIALGIGTLLLGGWVLNTPADDQQTDAVTTPPSIRSETMSVPPGIKTEDEKKAEKLRLMKQRKTMRQDSDQEQGRSVEDEMRTERSRSRARSQRVMPSEPTAPADSYGEGSMGGLPVPPTQEQPQEGDQGGGGSKLPSAPTYRPSQYRPQNNFQNVYRGALEQRLYNQTLGNPSYSAQTAEKAFANQKVITSGVSPYMNLFRNDTAGGTIDNYSTFVRPALEQQSMNQKFGQDIYGLERNARIQSTYLQRLQQRPRTSQSITTPQYYRSRGSVNSYGSGSGVGNIGEAGNPYDEGQ
jgi:hypothetical protein